MKSLLLWLKWTGGRIPLSTLADDFYVDGPEIRPFGIMTAAMDAMDAGLAADEDGFLVLTPAGKAY